LSNAFSVSVEMMLRFFILRSFNVKKYINRLLNIEPVLQSWKKLHLVMLLLMFGLVLFASVLFWINNLDCRVYVCMGACHLWSCFVTKIYLFHKN